MTLKVRILQFLTTYTQLTARLKNFLRGWLLVLGLKEGLVKCATVCIKSEVILPTSMYVCVHHEKNQVEFQELKNLILNTSKGLNFAEIVFLISHLG